MAVLGWIIWALGCGYTILLLLIAVCAPAQRKQRLPLIVPLEKLAAFLLICAAGGLVVTAIFDVSKLHLLWFLPLTVVVGRAGVIRIVRHQLLRNARRPQPVRIGSSAQPDTIGPAPQGLSSLPATGVLFDIDALGGGFYGGKAWALFMRNVDAERLAACLLKHGDTRATLAGSARRFCIAVCGPESVVEYVKNVFAELEEKGLATKAQRIIENRQLHSEPLSLKGRVDASGRFVEDSWNRVSHDLCKEAGWGYAPETVRSDLEAKLQEELAELKRLPRVRAVESANRSVTAMAPRAKSSSKTGILAKLKVLVAVAMADGTVDKKERSLLESFCAEFGVESADLEQLFAQRMAVDRSQLPKSTDEKRQMLVDVLRMAAADGRVDDVERRMVAKIATSLRLNRDEVKACVEESRRVVSQRDKTTPTAAATSGSTEPNGRQGPPLSRTKPERRTKGDRNDCPFYTDGTCEAGEGGHPCSFEGDDSFEASCNVYKAFGGPAGLRTCSSCGTQWRSMYGSLADLGIFGPDTQVGGFCDAKSLLGLTCMSCGKSLCRTCLGRKIPATLPGGKCSLCGGRLNVA